MKSLAEQTRTRSRNEMQYSSLSFLFVLAVACLSLVDARKECTCGGLGTGTNPCTCSEVVVKAAKLQKPQFYASPEAINEAAAARELTERLEASGAFSGTSSLSSSGALGIFGRGQSSFSSSNGGSTGTGSSSSCGCGKKSGGLLEDKDSGINKIAPRFRAIGDLCYPLPTIDPRTGKIIEITTKVTPAYPGKIKCTTCNNEYQTIPYELCVNLLTGQTTTGEVSGEQYEKILRALKAYTITSIDSPVDSELESINTSGQIGSTVIDAEPGSYGNSGTFSGSTSGSFSGTNSGALSGSTSITSSGSNSGAFSGSNSGAFSGSSSGAFSGSSSGAFSGSSSSASSSGASSGAFESTSGTFSGSNSASYTNIPSVPTIYNTNKPVSLGSLTSGLFGHVNSGYSGSSSSAFSQSSSPTFGESNAVAYSGANSGLYGRPHSGTIIGPHSGAKIGPYSGAYSGFYPRPYSGSNQGPFGGLNSDVFSASRSSSFAGSRIVNGHPGQFPAPHHDGSSSYFDDDTDVSEVENPQVPADAVSLTLAYKNLHAPNVMYRQGKKFVPEDKLSFGHRTVPSDVKIEKKILDIPEEKLVTVEKPVVELKLAPPRSVVVGSYDEREEAKLAELEAIERESITQEESANQGDSFITYKDLGYAPISGHYARTHGRIHHNNGVIERDIDDSDVPCGPLGPRVPGYIPGSVVVHRDIIETENAADEERNFGRNGSDEEFEIEGGRIISRLRKFPRKHDVAPCPH